MSVPKRPVISTAADFYRKSFLLQVLFVVFFLCDFILALFSPIIVFLVGLVIHIGIFIAFMNSRCRLISVILEELHAQKDCAAAPEVVE